MTIQATALTKSERQLRRDARGATSLPDYSPELFKVLSIAEWALEKGFALATAKRLIATGQGPTLTKLSARRLGIQRRHDIEWMQARELAAPPAAQDLQDTPAE
jgi:hypothetical protein